MADAWQSRAAQYRQDLQESIPPEWRISVTPSCYPVSEYLSQSSLFTHTEQSILKSDATGLRDAIAAREFSACSVTVAYAKAGAVAHQTTNCLFDFFPDEAIQRAKWLDEELEKGGPVGALHGVPISVKSSFGIKGHRMTRGFLSDVDSAPAEEDATIISILRNAGAVFILTTALPQSIMHLETDSFLGPCLNPHNPKLTPGGSSGGESAIIAAGCSVLGIGSDIGGSIRAPAGAAGIFGFKPTAIRLPKSGCTSMMPGQEAIPGAFGPMGKSPRDMELFVHTVLQAETWKTDPTQAGMPWVPGRVNWVGGDKPRVGVMWDDGVVVPQPPIQRALKTAADSLKKAGYEVVDFEPFKAAESWELVSSLYFTDGGARIIKCAAESGEPVLPLTKWIMSQNCRERTMEELHELVRTRDKFRANFNHHLSASGVDIILSPTGYGPAQPLETTAYWSYTSMWNLLDLPSASFPTGLFVDVALDGKQTREMYLGEEDAKIHARYDPHLLVGAPLSLQIAGSRWEDEKVMEALNLVSRVVQGDTK
ncbi:hypothetical protein L198_04377 [Cryptococcus wingfieldii CBS 7118]|uniref:amidase n=1 Tax=Cryptococcus wingfieldii CBS 7118 TaxID=1295528 RepID=A0A1E3J4H9_9TREE|nr:hypothetical protein L198_04377 [Cryptococcus wingfieldii CBS 7118]ODN95759.1 hypothetical protein L198_04377 [Cryptococcus wingfieldii CBS 7118]